MQQAPSSPRSKQRATVRPKNSLESARLKQSSLTDGLKPPINEHDRASSGDDSLLELYRSNASNSNIPNGTGSSSSAIQGTGRKRVTSRESSRVRRKGSKGTASVIDPPAPENMNEESKWIHRDKLAQIESRELAEMGLRMGRASRANSRTKSVRTAKSTADGQEPTSDAFEEQYEEDAVTRESRKLQEVVDEDVEESRKQQKNDIFASHAPTLSQERMIPTRPGTSRIPVPASTPASYEEDSPLEMRHKRSGSFGIQKQRTRSRSGGSQHLLDKPPPQPNGTNDASTPNSPQSSPAKDRSASKGSTANRKPSAQRKTSGTQARSRANSTTDSPKRPTTSGGSRPPTARPEGEAPWIATMYKPDPRLPPDQQMLPTHAKRIAQMQAEAEAKAARETEKSEFRLLDSEESKPIEKAAAPPENDQLGEMQSQNGAAGNRSSMQSKRSSMQQKRSSMQNQRESGQWPLRTPSGHHIQDHEKRFSPQNGIEHGGYNLMPAIASQSEQDRQQSLQKRSSTRSHRTIGNSTEKERQDNEALAPVHQPVRLHPVDDDQEGQKKKGCGCCVVM